MTMARWGLIFSVMFGICMLAFNNCSNGFRIDEPLAGSTTANSQCRQKIMSAAKSEIIKNASLCESPVNYHCDLRRFRPGVGTATTQEVQCPTLAGLGEACISVTVYNFDTSRQLASAETRDSNEGGSYNRDEASCINTQITSQHVALIQAEGDSVNEAFEKSLELCRQRSRP